MGLPKTLPEVLHRAASLFPQNLAICDGEVSFTYSELYEAQKSISKSLSTYNLKKGDKVAICAENSHYWVTAACALGSIGLVLVPINPSFTESELSEVLERSGAKILFTSLDLSNLKARSSLIEIIPFTPKSWRSFAEKGAHVKDSLLEQLTQKVSSMDPMDLMFTSGTTGVPKGVQTSHDKNIKVFSAWSEAVGLKESDRYLVVNPFFHTFGYKAGWFAALLKGAAIFPMAKFHREKVLCTIEKEKITVLPGAPSLYELLLKGDDLYSYDLKSLRLAVTGAAMIPVRLVEKIKHTLGFKNVFTAYGLTEATGVVTISKKEDTIEKIATTSGVPISGVTLKCVDPLTLKETKVGEAGEIWVKGYNVMAGYENLPKETESALTKDGWLRTGDIGSLDKEGYLSIKDRLKDMYIMNGQNVYPADVERAIARQEGVGQVAVVGVKKQPQGEVGAAFVVAKKGGSVKEKDLKDFCLSHLAPYKRPFEYHFVEKLPLNGVGKVDKKALRELTL